VLHHNLTLGTVCNTNSAAACMTAALLEIVFQRRALLQAGQTGMPDP
jgi:hypothetical protein